MIAACARMPLLSVLPFAVGQLESCMYSAAFHHHLFLLSTPPFGRVVTCGRCVLTCPAYPEFLACCVCGGMLLQLWSSFAAGFCIMYCSLLVGGSASSGVCITCCFAAFCCMYDAFTYLPFLPECHPWLS
jgi:hypothetical protein